MIDKEKIVLLSNHDLTDRWNVKKQTISNWQKRYEDKFPQPDFLVSNKTVRLYLETTIEEFEQTEFFKKLIEKNRTFGKSPTEE
ncbi:hypothetical protein [Niallia sp. FSL K6-0077]|uniref:hypothetical protein n=1 Tax=Niallia sp. FSL K6-0077 TaxID=2954743 RepID=UPI0030F9A8C0